ncbi:MAG: hypothetical protein HRU38_23335 [Saccharospirillaceae bacterium]|nr:hypothetical protein [Saccharospirillaceae bacterium]
MKYSLWNVPLFSEHEKHKLVLTQHCKNQVAIYRMRAGFNVSVQRRIRKNGSEICLNKSHNLDRKVRNIYPRGNTFYRVAELIDY